MVSYKFTKKAVEDISHIWNYTSYKWSENQADKYYQILIESCKEIARNSELGKNYNSIAENLLGFKVGRHIIFYRKLKVNEVEIIRILHDQMDLESRILEV
jgi:toxin ParE1/3/4